MNTFSQAIESAVMPAKAEVIPDDSFNAACVM